MLVQRIVIRFAQPMLLTGLIYVGIWLLSLLLSIIISSIILACGTVFFLYKYYKERLRHQTLQVRPYSDEIKSITFVETIEKVNQSDLILIKNDNSKSSKSSLHSKNSNKSKIVRKKEVEESCKNFEDNSSSTSSHSSNYLSLSSDSDLNSNTTNSSLYESRELDD
jgi:hypothetical protein